MRGWVLDPTRSAILASRGSSKNLLLASNWRVTSSWLTPWLATAGRAHNHMG